jgi:hypothetical protein
MTSKFILIIPVLIIFIYQIFKNKWSKYLWGLLIICIPFLILYKELIPILINFVLVTKVKTNSTDKLAIFFRLLYSCLPIASILAILSLKSKKIINHKIFLITTISVISYQIIMLDYNSLMRHLPYAEFSASIILGLILAKKKPKYAVVFLVLYIILSVNFALKNVNNYPSYNNIKDSLSEINGRVLALNPNCLILIKGMPLNSTTENVFSYYYFNYDNNVDSKIEEYEQALKEGYFNYATISSYSSDTFPRYKEIEDLVRKYYCPVLHSNGSNGIDIYKKCK